MDDVEHATAIHGVVRWRPFRIEAVNQNRCVLSLLLHPTPEFPFLSEVAVAYHLGSLGLTVTTTVTNRDDVPIPFGLGFHPYLAVTTPSDRGGRAGGAGEGLRGASTTANCRPARSCPSPDRRWTSRTRKSVSGHELDLTFTELVRDDLGLATVVRARQRRREPSS